MTSYSQLESDGCIYSADFKRYFVPYMQQELRIKMNVGQFLFLCEVQLNDTRLTNVVGAVGCSR